MTDLSSKRLIVAKGLLFLLLAFGTSTLLLLESPSIKDATLLAILVWSACRFYYFLFYVLQHYVDPRFRYTGLFALLAQASRPRAAR